MSVDASANTSHWPAQSGHEELIRALTVERFTRWKPSPSANDRTEAQACPSVRDGLPFEPIARTVRARKYRRGNAATRSSS